MLQDLFTSLQDSCTLRSMQLPDEIYHVMQRTDLRSKNATAPMLVYSEPPGPATRLNIVCEQPVAPVAEVDLEETVVDDPEQYLLQLRRRPSAHRRQ